MLLVMSSDLPRGMSRSEWCFKHYLVKEKIHSGKDEVPCVVCRIDTLCAFSDER